MVATDTRAPHSVGEYFDTARSPLNPANAGHRFFVYGTFPLFLVKGVASAAGLGDYAHLHLVGRALAALFDMGTVVLTWRLGVLLAGPAAGLVAGLLMACSVAAIQQSHFFTVDSFSTFFATAAILALTRIALGGRTLHHLLFGAALGAALACRINRALLAALYPVTLVYAWRSRRHVATRLAWMSAAALAAASIAFRVFQPYAFAGPGFFDVRPAADFVRALETIRAVASGATDYPPSVQWIGRWPILFPGWNLLVWGLGPAFGLAALTGLAWAFVRRAPAAGDGPGAGRVVLLWVPLVRLHSPHPVALSAGAALLRAAVRGRSRLPAGARVHVVSGARPRGDRRRSRRGSVHRLRSPEGARLPHDSAVLAWGGDAAVRRRVARRDRAPAAPRLPRATTARSPRTCVLPTRRRRARPRPLTQGQSGRSCDGWCCSRRSRPPRSPSSSGRSRPRAIGGMRWRS